MYEWKVRSSSPVDASLEDQLNALEREGFEIFQVHLSSSPDAGGAKAFVVARRAVARRNTDIESLLADHAAEAKGRHAAKGPSGTKP